MIRHCVHSRLEGAVDEDQRTRVHAERAGLSAHLDGMRDFQHRRTESPETGLVRGLDRVFRVDFEDRTARDHYLDDPRHREIGVRLAGLTQSGPDGIFICDVAL